MVTFKEVDVKSVVPYDNNPRENAGAVEYVKNSIADFGFRKPVVVDENMVLLAGHTRIMALKELGVKRVVCAVVEGLSEDQKTAYRIKDNRAGELSLFDFDKVAQEILTFQGIDMGRYGFEPPRVEPPDESPEVAADMDGGEAAVICPRCGKVVK